jgi:plasmid stabilization system protein ParE
MNRPDALEAFAEELEKSLVLVSSQPTIGARSLNIKLPGVRRVHMARIHYHLYYRVVGTPPVVEVLALWHTSRGQTRFCSLKERGVLGVRRACPLHRPFGYGQVLRAQTVTHARRGAPC